MSPVRDTHILLVVSSTVAFFMSCTPQQEVRDADFPLGAVFDSIIGKVTKYIDTVETGYIEIDNTSPHSVDPLPDESPTPPTMMDYIITWEVIHGDEALSVVVNTKIGSLFFDETISNKEKWVLIPFVGIDIAATTNVWSYYT